MPKRIQRKRTKGWKMPPNTVSVCRPGRYGNPFRVGGLYKFGSPDNIRDGLAWIWSETNRPEELALAAGYVKLNTAAQAVEWFRQLRTKVQPFRAEDIARIHGKNLACFCPLDQPCHADVLLEIANEVK